MSKVSKLLVGAGFAGVCSLAVATAFTFKKRIRNIGDLLQSKNLKLLSLHGDYEKWASKTSEYNKEGAKHKFSSLTLSSTDSVAELRKKCSDVLNSSIDDHNDLSERELQAIEWCTLKV